jgi:hypothetical protein
MSNTPHADFYRLKGLIVSNHPELLEFITEAERRYCLHDGLVKALEEAKIPHARHRTSRRSRVVGQR